LAKSWQLHNSPVDCARELFKPLKHSASLIVSNEISFFGFASHFFVSEFVSKVGLSVFGRGYQAQAPTARVKYFPQVFSVN